MFGKKKVEDKAAVHAPTKAPKLSKSKKSKAVVNASGPGFFAAHVEKIVLTVILAAVGYFVFEGFTTKGYDSSKQPEALKQSSTELLQKISNENHWESIAEERQVTHGFAKKAEQARSPTDPNLYRAGELVWDPKPSSGYEKRSDPVLSPAQDLYVYNIAGAVAVEVPKETLDPYEDLEDAEQIKPKGSGNSRGGRGGGAAGGYGGGMYGGGEGGMGGGGYGGEGGGMGGYGGMGAGGEEPPRRLSAKYDMGAQVGATGASGGGMYGGGEGGGMGGMGGMGGAGMGGGYGMGGGNSGSRDGLDSRNSKKGLQIKVSAQPIVFNSITALVPHKEMVEEFKKVFENTGPTLPERDTPAYLSFELQRVDVTADPNRAVDENEWKTISDGLEQYDLPEKQKWATKLPLGRPLAEVIHPRQNGGNGLMMPIPPILVRDYRQFSKHPEIPWTWNYRPPTPARKPGGEGDGGEEDGERPMLPGSGGNSGAAGGMGGYGGGMGGYGGGMGGYGGEGGGMGGYGGGYGGEGGGMGGYGGGYGGEGGGMGGYGGEGGMGGMGSGGMGGMGSGGMGGMGGYGGGMGGYGGMGGASGSEPDEFKMLRCYDILRFADVRKVFRYRVRIAMRDPNYPEKRNMRGPEPSEMTDEVWARVEKVIEKEKDNPNGMPHFRFTPWSEPSEPVLVKMTTEAFAGEVKFDGLRYFATENGPSTAVSVAEPQGKVVASTLETKFGARIAGELEVMRGTVLNESFDAELIVPTSKIVKVLPDYDMSTKAVVADIRGGMPLAGDSSDDPLAAAGEMLIVHSDGRVEISNDIDDMFLYRMYTFADEKEAAEKASQAPPAGGAGGYGGMGGGGYGG